ncbi:hypothetical protein PPL_00258 [Heterostelium album PN500]|uniref:Sepiapterin reductase n=1 Tax=Heterostelium pallidum (strain ATCC 26659 / Pp 5 / PN500) TaxID=670386 RepID=D3AVZ2_HETP5|nr:hypothetical protein PPL_00258 [Heterostelium album PN500]EFA86465.1 hypothetical protein PPL_00258 [Heterostelium album PN500]|eukprot:XP_020438570.1 hypothetical protein PPL_00258 [Heterostelium album PN500]
MAKTKRNIYSYDRLFFLIFAAPPQPQISDLMKKLLVPQEVVVSRFRTQDGEPRTAEFKEALTRGYFLIKFPKMFGGMEIGVSLVKATPKDNCTYEWTSDSVKVQGKVEFQSVPASFKGTFSITTFEGTGCLDQTFNHQTTCSNNNSIGSMEYIQIWLLVVAGLRALGFSQALFNIGRLRTNVYSGNPTQVTGLTARLFAAWTLMSFTLCVATAYNPYNQTLFTVTWTSFVYALLHFLTETLIFKSSSFKDAIPPFIVATTSIVWMVLVKDYNMIKTIALVTGASKGFGVAVCQELCSRVENIDFHLFARSQQGLESTEKIIKLAKPQSEVKLFSVDFSDLKTLENVWGQSLAQIDFNNYQRIWLINNHGSLGVCNYVSELKEFQQIETDLTMNVTSVVLTSSLFLNRFKSSGAELGLINVSSGAAVKPISTWGVYCTGKAARHMLTRTIAEENTFSWSPGPMDTQMQQEVRANAVDAGVKKIFTDLYENKQLVDVNVSAGKMIDLLVKNTYTSGEHYTVYSV